MGSTEKLQRQVTQPLQVWSQAGNHIWGSCVNMVTSLFRRMCGLLLAWQQFGMTRIASATVRSMVMVAWCPGT